MTFLSEFIRGETAAIPAISAIPESEQHSQQPQIAEIAEIADDGAAQRQQEREIRAHIARVFPGHPEAGEALAVALANPGAALDALRLAADREGWAKGMEAAP